MSRRGGRDTAFLEELSKDLAKVLRYHLVSLGISETDTGWVYIDELQRKGTGVITRATEEEIRDVALNSRNRRNERRYDVSQDNRMIRALYDHSDRVPRASHGGYRNDRPHRDRRDPPRHEHRGAPPPRSNNPAPARSHEHHMPQRTNSSSSPAAQPTTQWISGKMSSGPGPVASDIQWSSGPAAGPSGNAAPAESSTGSSFPTPSTTQPVTPSRNTGSSSASAAAPASPAKTSPPPQQFHMSSIDSPRTEDVYDMDWSKPTRSPANESVNVHGVENAGLSASGADDLEKLGDNRGLGARRHRRGGDGPPKHPAPGESEPRRSDGSEPSQPSHPARAQAQRAPDTYPTPSGPPVAQGPSHTAPEDGTGAKPKKAPPPLPAHGAQAKAQAEAKAAGKPSVSSDPWMESGKKDPWGGTGHHDGGPALPNGGSKGNAKGDHTKSVNDGPVEVRDHAAAAPQQHTQSAASQPPVPAPTIPAPPLKDPAVPSHTSAGTSAATVAEDSTVTASQSADDTPPPMEIWQKYTDSATQRRWYWNERTEEFFFEDEAGTQGWTVYTDERGKKWWWNDLSKRSFWEPDV